jgi:hypothetical protein
MPWGWLTLLFANAAKVGCSTPPQLPLAGALRLRPNYPNYRATLSANQQKHEHQKGDTSNELTMGTFLSSFDT